MAAAIVAPGTRVMFVFPWRRIILIFPLSGAVVEGVQLMVYFSLAGIVIPGDP